MGHPFLLVLRFGECGPYMQQPEQGMDGPLDNGLIVMKGSG
jgi:hypothetical protein